MRRSVSNTVLVALLLCASAQISAAKSRRPSSFSGFPEDDQVHSDIRGAIDANRKSATEEAYRTTGRSTEDVFANFAALRDNELWNEACAVLKNLSSEDLALYDDPVRDRTYASIPCHADLVRKLDAYWQDSQRLIQIHVQRKRMESKLSFASTETQFDRSPASRTRGKNLSEERPITGLKQGEVVLVFEGGPVPGRTEQVLETLKKMGVRADFLISGTSCRAHPELVRKIASQHEGVGSFAMTSKPLDRMPIKDAENRIDEARESVDTAADLHSSLFGFPLLASSPDLIDYLNEKKMNLLVSNLGMAIGRHYMTVDSRDWQLTDPSALYDHVTSNLEHGPFLHPGEGGTVILLHDGYAATGIALPYIIEEILARGLKPVVVI